MGNQNYYRRVKRKRRTQLTYLEQRYLAYCEQFYYLQNKGFPTHEEAATKLKVSVHQIVLFLENQNVIDALEKRGLPWQEIARNGILEPRQIATAMVMMDFADSRPNEQKLDELGVSTTEYRAWLNNPLFNEFVNSVADRQHGNLRPIALAEFQKKIQQGDKWAIQYYLEVTGQFRAPETHSLHRLLETVIEVLQKRISDPVLLATIAGDLMAAAPNSAPKQIEASPREIFADEETETAVYSDVREEFTSGGVNALTGGGRGEASGSNLHD